MRFPFGLVFLMALYSSPLPAQSIAGTQPLTETGDLAAKMVGGIDAYLAKETVRAVAGRAARWKRDLSSREAYERSVEPNRLHLRKLIGLVDSNVHTDMQFDSPVGGKGWVAESAAYRVFVVRWHVLDGVDGEGLLLEPNRTSVASVVALPDCDWTPEMIVGLAPGVKPLSQFARRLAENGCRVLVPVLIDRRDNWSGIPGIRYTNQPHREYLWRAAYELGRTPIGYEVQKVLAAVDWMKSQSARPVGVFGYGEGGLIALYAGACDTRIDATVVSGYFGPREGLWQEPIYRNVFGLLTEFGDAEIASLIAPRSLIVEACAQPKVMGPPAPHDGRSGAAPGAITTRPTEKVADEFTRAKLMCRDVRLDALTFVAGEPNSQPGSDAALSSFLHALGKTSSLAAGPPPKLLTTLPNPDDRMKRQLDQLMAHTQKLMRDSPNVRKAYWKAADDSSATQWRESTRPYREQFWDNLIGKLPPPVTNRNPRSRLVYDTPRFRGYEVTLDVLPEVFAYGILLLPKDLKPGERRPVVVCQHGLEGRPQDVANPDVDSHYYHRFACQLAERGFITFAPQNPYIGETRFRQVLHRAQPLGLTLFSFIVRQHEQILDWLSSQPWTDPDRIAFYGLSYGGKTAMRVPAVLERYCLSICSGDFNEWVWKCVSNESAYSYLLTNEYDMPEWDLANSFNYAEMSGLIAPRPFMVERGHDDGVAPDEWVAYEFAKTRRLYDKLGIGDRTEIEFFNGPHTIHGVRTFDFLHEHLGWPKPRRDEAAK
jgi:dienelactone hydrolase